ncbi:MAG: DUF1802 family protein [Gemmataceae bacterium]
MTIAFKEWAGIVAALAAGDQCLILRKGGIAETEGDGAFRPKHTRFWFYPTLLHEHQSGLKPRAAAWQATAAAMLDGERRCLQYWADAIVVQTLANLETARELSPWHFWTDATIDQRFHYRQPGLVAMLVRVYRAEPQWFLETSEYRGCKSWVELSENFQEQPAEPVLSESAWAEQLQRFRELLRSTPE